jgi:hypothetical protein
VFGDAVAFCSWYENATCRVYGYLYGCSGGDIGVDELQETFVHPIRHGTAKAYGARASKPLAASTAAIISLPLSDGWV